LERSVPVRQRKDVESSPRDGDESSPRNRAASSNETAESPDVSRIDDLRARIDDRQVDDHQEKRRDDRKARKAHSRSSAKSDDGRLRKVAMSTTDSGETTTVDVDPAKKPHSAMAGALQSEHNVLADLDHLVSFRPAAKAPWWRPAVPWTVYRYVFREIIRVFVLANLAVCLLYMTLVAYQAVRSGLQLNLVWPLILKTFAYPLYYSIPISFLIGITLVIGRMVGDLEIVALRTNGFSHAQIYTPVLLTGLLLAGATFYMNGWVVPHIHYEKRNIHKYVMEQLQSLGSGVNRRIRLPNQGALWIGAYRGTELRRVRILLNTSKRSNLAPVLREHLPEGLPTTISVFAREGKLDLLPDQNTILLELRGVDVLVPEVVASGGKVANETFHQRFAISDTVLIPVRFDRKRPSIKDRTTPQLAEYISQQRETALAEAARMRGVGAQVGEGERDIPETVAQRSADEKNSGPPRAGRKKKRRSAEQRLNEARTERHRRTAFAISCLTFPLLGVSLALLLHRRGRLIPFFVGNLVIIALFYPLLMVGVSLGEAGLFPPVSLALPNLVLLGLGVFLTRKVVKQ